MSKVSFYVQFRRERGWQQTVRAIAMTQNKPTSPRRGSGSIVVKLTANIPDWVFDPLDLVAEVTVPAENAEPLIALDSVGPILDDPETES